ncbi:unnamed protein product [Lupinus luteus]|uniref:Uncharacterized protein n=1 Tax=Lupinus luteus TaxID=3873 RepID=A0AAV1X7Z3_LUPLU
MSTGWRRAFCTRDPESSLSDNKEQPISPSPRSYDVPLIVAHKNENDVVAIEKMRAESSSSVSKINHIQPPQQKHVSDSVRSYDDDEPLLSTRFVPIPEDDEDGDEEQQQNDDVDSGLFSSI